MPLGFERLNEHKQRPNTLINFIKPLPGPTFAYAQDFLERVAAICHPIMKAHYLVVMSLEEFPPNPEFVGRNFNAGEVIQLVLKSRDGRWLPFRHVQMVMMHELAHCKQMNHSRFFWQVRDTYAADLRELWQKGYTGDGFWGKGRTLLSAEYEREDMPPPELEPRSLCGGTYRSRGRKRKRSSKKEKEKLTYAERQQRRILKKFGAGGTTLGNDEIMRAELEKGKTVKGKPRVAGSARGRELRAAAALARLEQAKKEQVKAKEDTSSETESDCDDFETEGDSAVDFDGRQMLDSNGHGLVKVCPSENDEDDNTRRELEELYEVDGRQARTLKQNSAPSPLTVRTPGSQPAASRPNRAPKSAKGAGSTRKTKSTQDDGVTQPIRPFTTIHDALRNVIPSGTSSNPVCTVCSFINEPEALTCAACANVIDRKRLPSTWKCQSLACRGGKYVNAGDVGVCGVCGASKQG